MSDFLFPTIRIVVLMFFAGYICRQKANSVFADAYGFSLVSLGLVFIALASLLEMTPHISWFHGNMFFDSTMVHRFLVNIPGYTLGMILTLSGLITFLPLVSDLMKARIELENVQDDNRLLSERIKVINDEQDYEIEKRTKELSDKVQELEITRNDLIQAEKTSSLGGLVASVSHEISNPVGVAITASSFMSEQLIDVRRKVSNNELTKSQFESFLENCSESTDILQTNLNRAATLVSNFKELAVDQTSDDLRLVDMNKLVQILVDSITPTLKNTQIRFKIEIQKDLSFFCYSGHISQILTHLSMNAIKHGFNNRVEGQISIKAARKRDGKIALEFKDNGTGVSGDIMSKLFDPFFTAKKDRAGTGLGLNIVYTTITQKLRGSIQAFDAKPGLGYHIIFKDLT